MTPIIVSLASAEQNEPHELISQAKRTKMDEYSLSLHN